MPLSLLLSASLSFYLIFQRKFSNGISDDAYWEKIKKKGKTNVTVQKRCLQLMVWSFLISSIIFLFSWHILQADTLHQHHYDVVFHSCVPGRERDWHIIDFYATPGNARRFIAGADQKESDSYGATIFIFLYFALHILYRALSR